MNNIDRNNSKNVLKTLGCTFNPMEYKFFLNTSFGSKNNTIHMQE